MPSAGAMVLNDQMKFEGRDVIALVAGASCATSEQIVAYSAFLKNAALLVPLLLPEAELEH